MSAFEVSNTHVDAIVTAMIWAGLTDQQHAESVADELLAQNRASVAYRYNEEPNTALYIFCKLQGTPEPKIVIKACECYKYQSCETPDWEETNAYKMIQELENAMALELAKDCKVWEINDSNIFRTFSIVR